MSGFISIGKPARDLCIDCMFSIQGWTQHELDSLPVGVALPLREALHKCRRSPPAGVLTQHSSLCRLASQHPRHKAQWRSTMHSRRHRGAPSELVKVSRGALFCSGCRLCARYYCTSVSAGWSAAAYALVGRMDLAEMASAAAEAEAAARLAPAQAVRAPPSMALGAGALEMRIPPGPPGDHRRPQLSPLWQPRLRTPAPGELQRLPAPEKCSLNHLDDDLILQLGFSAVYIEHVHVELHHVRLQLQSFRLMLSWRPLHTSNACFRIHNI